MITHEDAYRRAMREAMASSLGLATDIDEVRAHALDAAAMVAESICLDSPHGVVEAAKVFEAYLRRGSVS